VAAVCVRAVLAGFSHLGLLFVLCGPKYCWEKSLTGKKGPTLAGC
jgi:hypothetical protein